MVLGVSLTHFTAEPHPTVSGGFQNLRLVKTAQNSFVNAIRDVYRSDPDFEFGKRILCVVASGSWIYKALDIDYNKAWESVKLCIMKSVCGDCERGAISSSAQNSLFKLEQDVLKQFPEISSIEMAVLNCFYKHFDFTAYKGLVETTENNSVFTPIEKPFGSVHGRLTKE